MSIISFNAGTLAQVIAQGVDVQGSVNLNKLSDVTVLNPQNNQVLKYNSTSQQWENVAAGSITELDLGDLTDVVITSPSTGEVIAYNSVTGNWENTAITVTDVDGGTY